MTGLLPASDVSEPGRQFILDHNRTSTKTMVPPGARSSVVALHGLAEDCRKRQVLGPDVDIVALPIDETNSRIRADRIVADTRRSGGRAKAGLPVALGGFHVSGCISMQPVMPPEIQAAMDMGISMFAGEAEEGRLDEVLRDAWSGTLKPLYSYMDDLPSMEGAPPPSLPAAALARNEGRISSFDLGRGCPFQCSFCTIINVQGRKSRFRTADELEAIVRDNDRQGITTFFITDDNMARNKH